MSRRYGQGGKEREWLDSGGGKVVEVEGGE